MEKSRTTVASAAADIGLGTARLALGDARLILQKLCRESGIIAVAARFAMVRLLAKAAREDPPPNEDQAPPSPEPMSLLPRGTRLPQSELISLLAHSLGREKSEEVVREAAQRLHIRGTSLNRAEALAVLSDLGKSPGVVGVTARFARPRCVLRFPEE